METSRDVMVNKQIFADHCYRVQFSLAVPYFWSCTTTKLNLLNNLKTDEFEEHLKEDPA